MHHTLPEVLLSALTLVQSSNVTTQCPALPVIVHAVLAVPLLGCGVMLQCLTGAKRVRCTPVPRAQRHCWCMSWWQHCRPTQQQRPHASSCRQDLQVGPCHLDASAVLVSLLHPAHRLAIPRVQCTPAVVTFLDAPKQLGFYTPVHGCVPCTGALHLVQRLSLLSLLPLLLWW